MNLETMSEWLQLLLVGASSVVLVAVFAYGLWSFVLLIGKVIGFNDKGDWK
jgi:hypothetical protein